MAGQAWKKWSEILLPLGGIRMTVETDGKHDSRLLLYFVILSAAKDL